MPQMLGRRSDHVGADQHAVRCRGVERQRAFVPRLYPRTALIGEIAGPADRAVGFGAADRNDLRVGEGDAEGHIAFDPDRRGERGGIAARDRAVVRGFVEQRVIGRNVACEKHVALAAAHRFAFVAGHALVVGFEPGLCDIEPVEGRRAAHGDQHLVEHRFPLARALPPDRHAVFVRPGRDFDPEVQFHVLGDDVLQRLVDARAAQLCQRVGLVEQRDLDTQPGKGLRHFEPDRPRSHHRHPLGQRGEAEHGFVGQRSGAQRGEGIGYCRARSGGHDNRARLDPAAIVEF